MVLTHRDAGSTNDDLDARDGDHGGLDAALDNPVVSTVREAKTENVLEDDHDGEALDGKVAVGVDDVQRASHRTDDHASNLEAEEHERDDVVVLPGGEASGSDGESVQADAADDEHGEHHDNAELGLVDAPVATGHELDTPVGEDAGNNEPNESTDESADVGVSSIHFVPVVRRSKEKGGNNDTDEDRPANHCTLDQAAP